MIKELSAANMARVLNNGGRIYKVDELKAMPVGTKFFHPLALNGVIVGKNITYMKWTTPDFDPSGFQVDGCPWDQPMLKLDS